MKEKKFLKQEGRYDFQIFSFQVDINSRARAEVITQYLQEAAWRHAEDLKVGYRYLFSQNLIWVLSRLKIIFNDYPRWGDVITVNTWPSGKDRLYFWRNFKVLNSHQQVLVKAFSYWLVLNVNEKKPLFTSKLKNIICMENIIEEKYKLDKIPKTGKLQFQEELSVKNSDLDVNNHVNNCAYIKWLVDCMEDRFIKNHTLTHLEVNYLGEAFVGEKIKLLTGKISDSIYLHKFTRSEDDKILTMLKTVWR
ncbi:MAG: hypothetical protein APR63_07415 [Desulfuromonas sp. SDB]|nr:MAG: hypothetical protein APR63_07415 [Desulfuromonas sp. SDB]